jgi:hypothetical protein
VSEPDLPPPRLVDLPGAAGDCLRQALAEQERGSFPRFAAVQERRARRSKRQLAVALMAVAAMVPLGLRLVHHAEPPVSVRAEPMPVRVATAAFTAPARPVASQAESPALSRSPSKTAVKRDTSSKPKFVAPRAVPAASAPPPRAEAPAPSPVDPNGGAKACAELARNGAAEQAMACYDKLADGSGVIAELALFEQARLAGKVLRQPARALATLDGYKQRFPNGSLRAEVMLARIDWLLGSGDRERALQAVEEALASGLLRERTVELERLRASLVSPQ